MPGLPESRKVVVGASAVVLVTAPLVVNPYYVLVLSYACVFSIACLALNLLLGTTGLLSLGHAAYFGLGAYAGGFTYVFLNVRSLELYLGTGVVAATLLAAVLGCVCVKTTRIYFTIVTLAFGQILHALFISGVVFRPFGGLGKGLFLLGGGGLYIPRFTIGGIQLTGEAFTLTIYYLTLLSLAFSAAILWRISRSPFGMALCAVRDNEVRAEFIGVPVRAHRWCAFVVSGGMTGLAGGLFGQLSRQVTPEQLHWLFSASLVVATVLGGTRYFLGPVVGAFVLVGLQEIAVRFALHRGVILGSLLIVVVLGCPSGVAGGVAHLGSSVRRLASRVWSAYCVGRSWWRLHARLSRS